jgi:ubiquinone/menaquinone biosynthesis C-methylase UbiE
MELFMELMLPTPESTVLDVGVSDGGFAVGGGSAATHNFFEAMYPWPERITAVSTQYLARFQEAFPSVACVRADGRDLPFADGEFDIGFSNAVIEHVGGRDDQRQFVHELCRVCRAVFVTTPNRLFPIEVHTLLPLVHWLPRRARDPIYAALRRPDGIEVELLTPRGFRALFPPGVPVRRAALWPTLVLVASA